MTRSFFWVRRFAGSATEPAERIGENSWRFLDPDANTMLESAAPPVEVLGECQMLSEQDRGDMLRGARLRWATTDEEVS